MNNVTPQQLKIGPAALLAAILFNADKVRKVKVKPDDASPEREIEQPIVTIRNVEEGVVCTVLFKEVVHYSTIPYEMQMQVVTPKGEVTDENSLAVIVFERSLGASKILNFNGKPAGSHNGLMQKALESLK